MRDKPSLLGFLSLIAEAGSTLAGRIIPEPPDPVVGVGLSRIRIDSADGALKPKICQHSSTCLTGIHGHTLVSWDKRRSATIDGDIAC